jgi:glycosyltransferase involved in cell wall biosynthesis
MKVIILTGEPFPNGMAATNRIKCYASAIKDGGIDCEVAIFRRTERYGLKPQNTEGKGMLEGVIPFHFIGGTPLRGSNVLKRQIDDRLDVWKTERYIKHNLQKGDVLLLYMGQYIKQSLRFMRVAHGNGALCVRDLCELPFGTGAETKKAIRLRKLTLEKQLPQLDGIISISDALLKLAQVYASPSCKHIKVPILVDFAHYYLPDQSPEAEVPYIFHAGTLFEQKDGILGMIEAFGKAVKQLPMSIRFVSTGNIDKSPHNEEINRLMKQYQLDDKLFFTGYLSDSKLRDYLSKASLVIIYKYNTQQNNYCFSTKLGEYLAAAKPVIITNVGEAMNWLNNAESAYVVEPEDTDVLAESIIRVFTKPEEARKIGIEGQKVCRSCFDYRNWSQPMVNFFKYLGKE